MRQELDAHVELLADRHIRAGMTAEEARAAARRRIGNALLVREEVYRMNSLPWIERMVQDLRVASRMLRRSPGVALVAIVTLALGIGATTAVFAVVNGVLIEPLPYPRPDALVSVWVSAEIQGARLDNVNLSSTQYLAFQEHHRTFESFGVWRRGAANVTGRGEPEEVRSLVVTHGTLPAIGVRQALGRWFSEADDTSGTPETAILAHGYWQRRFGGDPAVIGQTVTIDSRPREIIGVMPRGFRFPGAEPDVVLPRRFEGDDLLPNDVHTYTGIARLKPGVSLAQASDDVARMLPLWIAEYGTSREALEAARMAPALRPLKQDVVGDAGSVLWLLMGAVGIVLLIACANVANLLLANAVGRRHELAVRAALGAGRRHIARQMLAESLTLGLLGGAAGLGVAYGALRLLVALGPANLPRLTGLSIDPTVLGFTLAASLLSALAFGLVPVLRSVRPTISPTVQGRTLSQSSERRRLQHSLVVIQVALSVVLLVASGLMFRSFQALRNVHPGFVRPEQVQAVRVSIPETQVPEPERVAQMQSDIVAGLQSIPGVAAAAFTSALPMEAEFRSVPTAVTADGVPDTGGIPPLRRAAFVSPGYFGTLGIPLIAGRDFSWADVNDERDVAIVSERMAREVWGDAPAALGKRIRLGRVGIWREVVGVAGDVHDGGVHEAAPAMVYWRAGVSRPIGPAFVPRGLAFVARSDRAATEDLLARIRDAVWAINPNLPLARVQTLGDVYARSLSRTAFTLVMLAIAGSAALSLGLVGIYGMLSYAVSQRTHEIAIRLALGARGGQLRRRVMRDGLVLTGIGIVIGSAAAMSATRLMSGLLFGISPLDLPTYAVVILVLTVAAVLAGYLPARRASAMDPVEALKAD